MGPTTSDRHEFLRAADPRRADPLRIAAHACLTALEGRVCRPLPNGLREPEGAPERPLSAPTRVAVPVGVELCGHLGIARVLS